MPLRGQEAPAVNTGGPGRRGKPFAMERPAPMEPAAQAHLLTAPSGKILRQKHPVKLVLNSRPTETSVMITVHGALSH